jgi:hypothetical protein
MHISEQSTTDLLRGDQNQKSARRFRLMMQGLLFLLLLQAGSLQMLHAEEPKSGAKAPLDQIWPYSLPSKRPLNKQDQKYAEAALIQWLEAYLHREYEVIDQRFFWISSKYSMWGSTSKKHALYPENENGRWRILEEIEQDWHDPGFDLVRIWKVGIDANIHYFAIAMTRDPVPGTRGYQLFGRFELKKVNY